MKLKKIYTKAATLALACGALLATSCSGLLEKGDESATGKATVRFAGAAARSINSTFVQDGYSYQLKAVTSEEDAATTRYLLSDGSVSVSQPETAAASDFITASALTATGDAALSWLLDAGSYTFTLDAYKAVTSGEGDDAETTYTKALSGTTTATLSAGDESTLVFALDGVTAGSTGSLTLTVDFSGSAEKENVASAKVSFGSLESVLSDENASTTGVTQPATDATGDTTKNYTVVYTNSAVPAATTEYVVVYFYDVDGYLKGSYGPESVYVYAGDSITLSGESKVEFAELNLDKYPYTVYAQDYESVTAANEIAYQGNNSTIALTNTFYTTTLADYGNYFAVCSPNANAGWAYTTEYLPLVGTAYKMEFDISLAAPANAKATTFVISTADTPSTTADYLLSIGISGTYNYNGGSNDWEWTVNGKTTTSVTLNEDLFYHCMLSVEGDTVTLKMTQGSETLFNEALVPAGDSRIAKNFAVNIAGGGNDGRAHLFLDNIAIKSASDAVTFTTATAITGDTTIAAEDEATFTASAAAAYAGTGTAVTPTYAWSLAATDADYATLSAATGTSVTLTGTNSTINDHAAVVTCVATAAGTNTVTSSATKTVTVKALQSLLSDVTVSAAESATSVAAGSTLALTASGGEADENLTEPTVTWTWTSADTSVATVSGSGNAATVSGASVGNTTITVTATLGSIVKTATYAVEVTESEAALSALTISGATANTEDEGVDYDATVKAGFTATITATTNDNVVPDSWSWESSDTEKFTVTASGDSYTSTATITGVATGNATLTLTAVKGSVTLTKTIDVEVTEPTKVTLYSQNFESGSSDWTAITSGYDKCAADDITSNANTSSYIYAIGCRSGDTGTQVAVSSSTDGTIVEFDLKFDGVYAAKASSFALLGAKNTANWLASDKEILTFTAGSTTAGYINTFTINGTDCLSACSVSTDGSESSAITGNTLKRGSTGWLHVKASLNFTDHTMDVVVTKIATSATVYEASGLAFMDGSAASSLEYLYAAAGKSYGGVYMDNFEVYTYE